MKRAKSLGIDAFALNIGVDPYTDQQLQLAYQSAANNDMKVFISFDFNWWNTGQGFQVGQKIAQYASLPAQLKVDGKVFVSSFAGDGLDVAAMRQAAGQPIFWAPNYHPEMGTNMDVVDGLLNWMAWPNNGNNKAPQPGHNISVQDGDDMYIRALNGKDYIARKLLPFETDVPFSRVQLRPRGSSPILALRSLTARTGSSQAIFCGMTAGTSCWQWALVSSRLLHGTTTAKLTISAL